jgi:hypothetical protein
MNIVKLPKTEYPELILDELEVLLGIYEKYLTTDLDSLYKREGNVVRSAYFAGYSHLWHLMARLFLDGKMYKITKISDILSLEPATVAIHMPSRFYRQLEGSLTCDLGEVPKYLSQDNEQATYSLHHQGVYLPNKIPSDAAIIAEWRLAVGM